MYLYPDGTTKPDAINYFKQRCTRESVTVRNTLPFAVVPAAAGYLLLLALVLAGTWVWYGFWAQCEDERKA
jgi:hypothetical protein